MVISREELFKDWKENTPSEGYVPSKWLEAYRKFKQSPPSILYMTATDIGWEVKTRDEIPAETIICEYLGEYDPLPENCDTVPLTMEQKRDQNCYRVETTNANKKGNIGLLFNDGTPQLRCIRVYNEQGIKYRYFFITLEKCPAGAILRWDYVQHFVKFEEHKEASIPHFIQTYKELKTQNGPLNSAMLKIHTKITSSGDSDLDLPIEEQNIYQKIFYLFTTPQPLIVLAVTQTISLNELLGCMEIVKKNLKIDIAVTLALKTLSYLNIPALSQQQVNALLQIASTKNAMNAGSSLIPYIPSESIERYNKELKTLKG